MHLLFAVAALAATSMCGAVLLCALGGFAWGPCVACLAALALDYMLGELAGRWLP